jgi:hypothetical protein
VAAPKEMRPVQAEAARRMLASDDGLLRPYPGGHWTTLRAGRRESWSAHIVTVRAMQAHGWLERCRQRPESWLDPRRLTEAGTAALARLAQASHQSPVHGPISTA